MTNKEEIDRLDEIMWLLNAAMSAIRIADRSGAWKSEREKLLDKYDDLTGRDNHGINHKPPIDGPIRAALSGENK